MDTTSPSPALQYLNSTNPSVDPVTKAVVDNILGNIPSKKEKVTLKCVICNLEFSSQIPLDMHLGGSKHNKKVQSQEILKTLKEEGAYVDTGSSNLNCEICNITSNSSQQLQMHLKGTKHMNKLKALSGDSSNNASTTAGVKRPASDLKDDDGAPLAKSMARRCETCNVSLNSESQYEQHISSQKHKNKLQGVKTGPRKWNNKQRPSFQQFSGNSGGNFQNGRKSLLPHVPPLSQSFNMNNRNFDDRSFNMERRFNNNNNNNGYFNNPNMHNSNMW